MGSKIRHAVIVLGSLQLRRAECVALAFFFVCLFLFPGGDRTKIQVQVVFLGSERKGVSSGQGGKAGNKGALSSHLQP